MTMASMQNCAMARRCHRERAICPRPMENARLRPCAARLRPCARDPPSDEAREQRSIAPRVVPEGAIT